MSEFIKIENLSFSYEGEDSNPIPAIKNLSLTFEKGSFVSVLGHNGSGKSTLAMLINTILTPTSGKIYIDGTDITSSDITDEELYNVRKKIGMVFQNPDNQLVATVVEEDVAFGCENLGIPPKEIRLRVDDALKKVGMFEFKKHSPHQLSGGQKQRVAIAGVIAMQPECIIFDESTAMLDPRGRHEIMDAIAMLRRELGITVILITHYMNEAVNADRVIVMDDGEIALDGTPEEVFSHVELLRSLGLDVPCVTELFENLRKDGIDLPKDVIHINDGADALAKLLSQYSKNPKTQEGLNR